jgi:hypothetical protein
MVVDDSRGGRRLRYTGRALLGASCARQGGLRRTGSAQADHSPPATGGEPGFSLCPRLASLAFPLNRDVRTGRLRARTYHSNTTQQGRAAPLLGAIVARALLRAVVAVGSRPNRRGCRALLGWGRRAPAACWPSRNVAPPRASCRTGTRPSRARGEGGSPEAPVCCLGGLQPAAGRGAVLCCAGGRTARRTALPRVSRGAKGR